MSKLIRVSDEVHKKLHNVVKGLDFKDVNELIGEMIQAYQRKIKNSGVK